MPCAGVVLELASLPAGNFARQRHRNHRFAAVDDTHDPQRHHGLMRGTADRRAFDGHVHAVPHPGPLQVSARKHDLPFVPVVDPDAFAQIGGVPGGIRRVGRDNGQRVCRIGRRDGGFEGQVGADGRESGLSQSELRHQAIIDLAGRFGRRPDLVSDQTLDGLQIEGCTNVTGSSGS